MQMVHHDFPVSSQVPSGEGAFCQGIQPSQPVVESCTRILRIDLACLDCVKFL
ncbi:MAG: hypothetical protein HXS53_02690 [Theionarchaea archaeon]|nr:hypothetical protein [Theionarchaea archaeon]